MRLLVINPNTSQGVTARIRQAADAVAQPEDHFTTLCPTYGPELIVTQADADHATQAVVDTVKAHSAPCDGIILASFGNTGAQEVRAVRPDIPVIGIATAAFSRARSIGGPFGIVTFGESLVPGLQAKAHEAGLGAQLLATLAVQTTDFGDPGTVQSRYAEELADLCAQLDQRGATCIVMGGGPLAGLAAQLAASCSVPLIDGTQTAIQMVRSQAHRNGS